MKPRKLGDQNIIEVKKRVRKRVEIGKMGTKKDLLQWQLGVQ